MNSEIMENMYGIAIQEDKHMVGFKFAVQFGDGPIILSPAMMSLVRTAGSDKELRHLLSNIPLRKMPRLFDPRKDLLGITTHNPFSGDDHVAVQQEKAGTQEGDYRESSGGVRHDGPDEPSEPDRAD